jgi:hypothetical protein
MQLTNRKPHPRRRSRLGARPAIQPKDAEYARNQGAEMDDTSTSLSASARCR